jgi:hypothetical protein
MAATVADDLAEMGKRVRHPRMSLRHCKTRAWFRRSLAGHARGHSRRVQLRAERIESIPAAQSDRRRRQCGDGMIKVRELVRDAQ